MYHFLENILKMVEFHLADTWNRLFRFDLPYCMQFQNLSSPDVTCICRQSPSANLIDELSDVWYKSEGHILHFGTLPQYVPDLVMELLEWAKTSEVHMLIRNSSAMATSLRRSTRHTVR